jgi:hypothetical protein
MKFTTYIWNNRQTDNLTGGCKNFVIKKLFVSHICFQKQILGRSESKLELKSSYGLNNSFIWLERRDACFLSHILGLIRFDGFMDEKLDCTLRE